MDTENMMSPLVKTCVRLALYVTLIVATTGRIVLAQQTSADTRGSAAAPISTTALPAARIDEIVHAFSAKETRFREALNS
jgi:hypothetical protein